MLTIRHTKVFQGPSLWAPVPAILLTVDIGELEARLSRETPVFFEHLTALVPSLRDCRDVVSQPEGGLRRLLLDRLALALQNLAAAQVAQQGTRIWRDPSSPMPRHPRPPRTASTRWSTRTSTPRSVSPQGRSRFDCSTTSLPSANPTSTSAASWRRRSSRSLKRHAYDWNTGTIVAAAERRGIPVAAPGSVRVMTARSS